MGPLGVTRLEEASPFFPGKQEWSILQCARFFEAVDHAFVHEAFSLKAALNYAPPRPPPKAYHRWK